MAIESTGSAKVRSDSRLMPDSLISAILPRTLSIGSHRLRRSKCAGAKLDGKNTGI